jgi:O-antigen/teichoic acid export membrane protein
VRSLLDHPEERAIWGRLAGISGLLFGANGITGAMNFASFLLTVRHLSAKAFGVLNITLITMQFVNSLTAVGINESMVTLVSRSEAACDSDDTLALIGASLRARLIIASAGLALGSLLVRPLAGRVFQQPDLAWPLFLGVIGAFGTSLFQFVQTIFLSLRRYRLYSLSLIIRFAPILVALTILVLMRRLTLTTAILVNVGAPFLALPFSWSMVPVRVPYLRHDAIRVWPKLWQLSKWLFIVSLCTMCFSRLEVYFLTAFASVAQVGKFSAAFDLCGGLLLVEGVVRSILLAEISSRANMPHRGRFVAQCSGLLLVVGLLLFCGGVAARPFLGLILGRQYATIGPIFLVLVAARVGVLPVIPLNTLFFAQDRTRAVAAVAVVQLAALIIGGYSLIPGLGAMGAAWTQLLVTIAAIVAAVTLSWSSLAQDPPTIETEQKSQAVVDRSPAQLGPHSQNARAQGNH